MLILSTSKVNTQSHLKSLRPKSVSLKLKPQVTQLRKKKSLNLLNKLRPEMKL